MKPRIGRRAMLVGGVATGAGLVIGVHLPRAGRGAGAQTTSFAPSAWVRIDRTGTVTITTGYAEMGQGIWTSVACSASTRRRPWTFT